MPSISWKNSLSYNNSSKISYFVCTSDWWCKKADILLCTIIHFSNLLICSLVRLMCVLAWCTDLNKLRWWCFCKSGSESDSRSNMASSCRLCLSIWQDAWRQGFIRYLFNWFSIKQLWNVKIEKVYLHIMEWYLTLSKKGDDYCKNMMNTMLHETKAAWKKSHDLSYTCLIGVEYNGGRQEWRPVCQGGESAAVRYRPWMLVFCHIIWWL